MLQRFFLTLLDMSIAAGYCAILVMIIRLLMKKLPKSYSYALWAIVFVRLMMPAVPESAWSLFPGEGLPGVEQVLNVWQAEESKMIWQAEDGEMDKWQAGAGELGMGQSDAWLPGAADADAWQDSTGQSGTWQANAGQAGTGQAGVVGIQGRNDTSEVTVSLENFTWNILSGVWLAGSLVLLGYGLMSNVLLERRLKGAKKVEDGIFELENLPTAFVTGVLRPRIYLPEGLPEEYRRYVLAHEQTHLRRGDIWVKYVAYFLTSIHWFNPLVWISYHLMCRDMEMSCDERALQTLGVEEKKAYSAALLAIASGRRFQIGMPIAFGESNAKKRIVNVLNYRRPAFWVTAAAGVVLAVLVLGLLSDPREEKAEDVVTAESEVAGGTESEVADEAEMDATSESVAMAGSESDTAAESELYKLITPEYLAQVEQWIEIKARPNDMGFARWFDEYGGGTLQNLIDYDGEKLLRLPEDVVFYQIEEEEWIGDSVRKMLNTSVELSIMELEKYAGSLWLVEYEDDVYFLMRFKNTYRLQRFEDMQAYKEKEVELKDVPIYPEDLDNQTVLTEKLSAGVNMIFLFRDYEHVNEMNPVDDCQLVFDNIGGFWEEGIIDYYFDEEKYYEAMARKMGQNVSEFLAGHNLNGLPYKKVYRGWGGDSMHMEVEVTDVKWLDDSQAEIYYSGTYYDGVAVMKEYSGEMIFVSHRRIYESD